MEIDDVRVIDLVKKSILKKNDQIQLLRKQLKSLQTENSFLKSYQLQCTDLEKENAFLRSQLESNREIEYKCENGEVYYEDVKIESPEENVADVNEVTETVELNNVNHVEQTSADDMAQDDSNAEELLHNFANSHNEEHFMGDQLHDEHSAVFDGAISTGAVNGDSLSQKDATIPSQTSHEQILSSSHCPVCGKYCGGPAEVRRHLPRHTGEKPFQCKLCPFKAAYKSALTRHFKYKHTSRRLLCPHCHKPFVERHTLKIHLRTHHADFVDGRTLSAPVVDLPGSIT